jgi:GTP-binding protein
LVDIRHEPSSEDIAMFNVLSEAGYKISVIANKADKISKNARAKHIKTIAAALGVTQERISVFSAVTREGCEVLLREAQTHVQRLLL